MITVYFQHQHSVLTTLKVQGHAELIEVCSAVSLLLKSAVRVLADLEQHGLKVEVVAAQEGDFSCRIFNYPEELLAELKLWSNFLLIALRILADNHQKQIQLIKIDNLDSTKQKGIDNGA